MSRTHKLAVATAIAALAAPAAAQAHVTLQPNSAPAGAFTVLDVRVPTERDNASTAKVDVQFPAGFASVSYQPVPGWRVRVLKKKLATPVQTDDGPITEGVSRMIWTRTSRRAGIKPGQFQDFPISVQIPGKAGDKLTFKALQTYGNGEIVRWIGAPGSDDPAPQVTVTGAAQAGAAAASHKGMGMGATASGNGPAQPAAARSHSAKPAAVSGTGSETVTLAIGGFVLLLVAGGVVVAVRRRRAGDRPAPAAA
jgi:periplasmic copper chaperone A